MKQLANGFVLFIVLIFLLIFSLMGLYSLTTSSISIKLNRELWQREIYLLRAKNVLHELENQQMLTNEMPSCTIPITSSTELAKKPISWWQTVSCSGNLAENQYYYVLELLGKDPCGVIEKDNGKTVIVVYYRITLFYIPEVINDAKLILQSTIAKADEEVASCLKPHLVLEGHQMWREI